MTIENSVPSRVVTPHPDPTTLTTSQLFREISNLREVITARLDAMDKALELLQRRADRVPSETDIAIMQLKMLHDEKFKSVSSRIDELADRAKATSADSKEAITTALKAAEKAVEAALQAAKDAVAEQNKSFSAATAKSETSTAKQIDAIGAMIAATMSAVNDKIDDMKNRLLIIEGSGKGSKDLLGYVFTAGGILIAAIAAFIAFSKVG